MQKIQKSEKLIINRLKDNLFFTRAYEKTFDFYTMLDYLEQTNHCTVLQEIYKRPYRRISVVALSMKTHLSESTLIRYRRQYLKCFYRFYELEEINAEAAVTSSETSRREDKT